MCNKNLAHVVNLQQTPADLYPLPDGISVSELDARLERWIKFHKTTLMAATIHALDLPHEFSRIRTHILHLQISPRPRTEHGDKSSKFFRIVRAEVIAVQDAMHFLAPWPGISQDLSKLREENESMDRGSVAMAGVTCRPLGMQVVPFGSMRETKLSSLRYMENWEELLQRDVDEGVKFERRWL